MGNEKIIKKFEIALKRAKPMKGKMNDWQYLNLKKLLPDNLHPNEYERQIKRICDKIKY